MNENPSGNVGNDAPRRVGGGPIYLVTSDLLDVGPQQTEGLLSLWRTLWRGKWVIIVVSGLCGALAVGYSLTADKWYRAEVLMIPAESPTDHGGLADSLGSLGGIAGLAGISLGAKSSAEPMAILKSRQFIGDFIADRKLMPVLFREDFNDAGQCRWKDPKDCPDKHDAFKKFSEKVIDVVEDKKTSLVTVSVEWTDPVIAAVWANSLIERLNERMRQRAMEEAEASVSYLKVEMEQAKVVPLQMTIGRLLQNELQKAMLARATKEFAFRVLDRAEPPKWRIWPKRLQIVAFALVLGALLSSIVVLVINRLQSQRARSPEDRP